MAKASLASATVRQREARPAPHLCTISYTALWLPSDNLSQVVRVITPICKDQREIMATDCWFAIGLRDINSVHDLLSNSRHRFRASLDSFYTPFIIFAGEDPERIRDKIFCAILPSTSSPRVHPCHTFLKVAIDSSKSFPYALCLRAKDSIRMESITSKRGEQQLCKSRLPGEDNIHRSFIAHFLVIRIVQFERIGHCLLRTSWDITKQVVKFV